MYNTSDKSTFVLSDDERFQMFADIVASKQQLNSNYVIFKEKKTQTWQLF